jgi:hypothetical protein
MKRGRLPRYIASGLVLGVGFLSTDLAGYIDPGTGSYIFQMAIAFLVGIAFSLRVFRRKVAALLRKVFSRKKGNGTDAS